MLIRRETGRIPQRTRYVGRALWGWILALTQLGASQQIQNSNDSSTYGVATEPCTRMRAIYPHRITCSKVAGTGLHYQPRLRRCRYAYELESVISEATCRVPSVLLDGLDAYTGRLSTFRCTSLNMSDDDSKMANEADVSYKLAFLLFRSADTSICIANQEPHYQFTRL